MERIIDICLQIVVVPLVGFIFHVYSKRSVAIAEDKKKIVDLERAITKQERDKQYLELKNESARLRMEIQHSIEEINQTLLAHKNMLDRIFCKFDKMEDRK